MKRFIAIFMTLCLMLGISSVSAWATDEGATWQKETPIPVSRCDLVTCVVGSKIYALGGNSDLVGRNIYNDVYIYDTATKTWSKGKDMPEKLNGFGAIAVGSKIYVLGGKQEDGKTISSKTWIYDTQNNTWTEGEPMPKAKYYFGIAEAKNKIYIVCGAESTENYSKTVEIYDIGTKKWTTGSSADVGKYKLGLAKVGDELFTMGGVVNSTSNPIQTYNIETNTWKNLGNNGINDTGMSFIKVDGKIYMMGGGSATLLNVGHPSYNYVKIYDPVQKKWGETVGFNFYLDRLGAAFVNGTIYMIGGRTKGNDAIVDFVYSLKIKDGPNNDAKLSVLLNIGEQVQLSTSFNLDNNKNFTWSSTNEAVATVDSNGKVSAIAEGTADIYAQNAEGTFKEYIPVKVVKGVADELRLAVHLKTAETANLYINDDPGKVTWSSMDESIATVSADGQVTGVKKGLAIVKAELDGQAYQIYVRVNG